MGVSMRSFLLLTLAVPIVGCASEAGWDIFKFKKEPISLHVPADCLYDRTHKETDNSVDYTMGKYYWTAFGLYSVQVFHRSDKTPDRDRFLEAIKTSASAYLANDRSPDFVFQPVREAVLDVKGEPAYQVVGVDKGKAVIAVTFVLHKNRITAASLMYPEESSPDFHFHFKPVTLDVPYAATFPWGCYNRFMDSVEETD